MIDFISQVCGPDETVVGPLVHHHSLTWHLKSVIIGQALGLVARCEGVSFALTIQEQ